MGERAVRQQVYICFLIRVTAYPTLSGRVELRRFPRCATRRALLPDLDSIRKLSVLTVVCYRALTLKMHDFPESWFFTFLHKIQRRNGLLFRIENDIVGR